MSDRQRVSGQPDEMPLPPIGTAALREARSSSAGRQPTYTRRQAPAPSPWNLIGLGSLACLIGALLANVGSSSLAGLIGIALIGLGSIVIGIGTIAEGVRIGARWVAFDRGE